MLIRFISVLVAGCFALIAGQANAYGPLSLNSVDFTPGGTQPGLQIPIEGAINCQGCHGGNSLPDAQILPHSSWSGSMMANSARDPLFWAAVDIANNDVPGIGDWCLRCHVPNAWLQGRAVKDGMGGTNPEHANGCSLSGSLVDSDDDNNDFGGINCHFCHRVMPTGPANQPTELFNAKLWFDDSLDCNGNFGPCRRGPYNYPVQTPVGPISEAPHGWKFEPYVQKSEFCGVCHDISPPGATTGSLRNLILPNGTDSGRPFPLDRTFSEWNASDYSDVIFANAFRDADLQTLAKGETCQTCHMRNSSDPAARACVNEAPGTRTNNIAVHEFVGSNVFIPRILKGEYGAPNLLDREAAFDRTIQWTRDALQRSTLVEVALDPINANNLTARVKVTNLSGHKLPSGFIEGRRIWINAVARDANGVLLWESGAYNPNTAVLTSDPQLKVYEAIQGIWQRFGQTGQCVVSDPTSNRKLFNFALHDCILKDNRIPPRGFRGGSDLELRPVNYVYPETAPGSGRLVNFDVTTYSIAIPPGAPRPITVSAMLRSQTLSKDYAEFLRDEAALNATPTENQMCNRTFVYGPANKSRGLFMYDLWVNYGKDSPEPMRNASASTPP